MLNWNCLFAGKKSTTPSARASFQPRVETLEERAVPTAVASPVTLSCGVLSIAPANTGVTSIDIERVGNTLQVFYNNSTYNIAAGRVGAVLVDGSHAGAGSEIDVLQDTAFATELVGGAGTNNFIAGSGTTIFVAGTGTNNFIGGSGSTLFVAATNGNSNFSAGNGFNEIYLLAGGNSVTGGSGLDVYFIAGGTNSVDLGSGYSAVFDLGGNNLISSGSTGTGFILNLDPNPSDLISVDSGIEVISPTC